VEFFYSNVRSSHFKRMIGSTGMEKTKKVGLGFLGFYERLGIS